MPNNLTKLVKSLLEIVKEANQTIDKLKKENIDVEEQLVNKFFETKTDFEQNNDFETNSQNNADFIDIISLISINRKTSLFKLKTLTIFIRENFLNNDLVKTLNESQIDILFKCCQVNLDPSSYYYNGDDYDSNFFNWKKTLCYLVETCNDETFCKINIITIQRYLE
jgi:hypothetical protein